MDKYTRHRAKERVRKETAAERGRRFILRL